MLFRSDKDMHYNYGKDIGILNGKLITIEKQLKQITLEQQTLTKSVINFKDEVQRQIGLTSKLYRKELDNHISYHDRFEDKWGVVKVFATHTKLRALTILAIVAILLDTATDPKVIALFEKLLGIFAKL